MNESQSEAYWMRPEQEPHPPDAKPCCADHHLATNRQQRREADKHCKIRRY
jgi:hypothetical protein